LDRDFEPGDEPVKLCVQNGQLVEFRKQVAADLTYDFAGESVGFFRFESAFARRLATRTEYYVAAGRHEEPYEEAIRDLLLETPSAFGYEDITGLPWIEIDFPEDMKRAENEILPLLGGK
jgi:choline kinase